LEQKNQENKGLIDEKAFVSQLQDQHSIELANHKTKLDDACKHYQTTLEEEQSKLQLVTQELEMSKSDIVQLKADAKLLDVLRGALALSRAECDESQQQLAQSKERARQTQQQHTAEMKLCVDECRSNIAARDETLHSFMKTATSLRQITPLQGSTAERVVALSAMLETIKKHATAPK
jgi:hypothetical protein